MNESAGAGLGVRVIPHAYPAPVFSTFQFASPRAIRRRTSVCPSVIFCHLRNAVASKMSRMQIAQGATPSSRNVLIYIRVSTVVHAQELRIADPIHAEAERALHLEELVEPGESGDVSCPCRKPYLAGG